MRERRSSRMTSRSGPDHLVGEDQVAHAVGLVAHHRRERVRRHGLVIGGVVPGGEGVLAAADLGDLGAELAGLVVLRALEHQVLEEMRDAGFARRLVGAADLVPDHVRDDRRAVVGDDDDLHAVVEHEVADVGCRPNARPRRQTRPGKAPAMTSAAASDRSRLQRAASPMLIDVVLRGYRRLDEAYRAASARAK